MNAETTTDGAFYAAVALLFAHELDAVERHEWRLFPGLRSLPDAVAGRIFVLLHVPLFAGVLALAAHPSRRTRRRFRLALAAFAVVHAGLHARFSAHPDYEFDAPSSKLLILGAAAAGVVHLCLTSTDVARR